MKKVLAIVLLLILLFGLIGCANSEGSYRYYFIGEVVEHWPSGGLVKVVNYGNHKFYTDMVIIPKVRKALGYEIGDRVWVRYAGVFRETLPPILKDSVSVHEIRINMSNLFPVLMAVLWVAALIAIVIRAIRNKKGKVKSVPAEVVGKQTVENFSKYSGTGKQVRYVVNFAAGGKKLSFYVSEFSYHGYKKGEKGTLKYRGDRLIDFH